jgi:hypothetical protein
MKTDPKQHDYVCESGASRNYEPWRDMEHAERVLKAKSQLEDDTDVMKRVEKKGFNSKREMEILDALNDVKQLNRRTANVNHEELLVKTLQKFDVNESHSEQVIARKLSEFETRRKFKRLEDNESLLMEQDELDNNQELVEIQDPFALLGQNKTPEEVVEEQKSESEESSSSDSDIDIVQRTKQHRINPLEFL